MAEFIRGKVKKGDYTNSSEVVRDALRRMQEAESARQARALPLDPEAGLTETERDGIRQGIAQGIDDIDADRYEEYDAGGLKELARELVARSVKNLAVRKKLR